MTIYQQGPIQCSGHRIFSNLYSAQGLPRTAQTLLCTGPGGVTVDIINVHAPSGRQKLTDFQRTTLLRNLLQSNSLSIPGAAVGGARFFIGGDMNTGSFRMSQLLQDHRELLAPRTEQQLHQPTFLQHGDLCISGGFPAETQQTITIPCTSLTEYVGPRCRGLLQSSPRRELQDQLHTKSQPCQHESPGAGRELLHLLGLLQSSPCKHLQEQLQPRNTCHKGLLQSNPRKHLQDQLPEPAMPAPLDGGMQRGASSAGSATEQPWQASPAATPAPLPEPARREREAEPNPEDMHAPAAAAATEPSHELPADKQMICAIVNEFLGKVTFNNPEAEALLVAALVDESSLSLQMYAHLEEVFSPIFFHYQNGLKDRSDRQPNDTSQYIRQWYEVAACRLPVLRSTAAAAATEHGTELSKAQATLVFQTVHGGPEDRVAHRPARQEMDTLQILHRGQNETHGWTHLRGQRHLDDRPSSSALVCHRAARSAAIPTRPGSRPRRHSQCVELVRPPGWGAAERPCHERVSRRSAQGRRGTRRVGSLCYRARGTHSHPHGEVQHLVGEMSGERIHGRQKGAHWSLRNGGSSTPTGRVLCSSVWWRLRASTKEIPCTDHLCFPEQCYRACCGAPCDRADARSPRVLTIKNHSRASKTATARATT